MASLCREFGISRKTGYKIQERYEECGWVGLTDRAHRPYRYANQLPVQVEAEIVAIKKERPHWGARKIRERLLRRLRSEIKVPARSTILLMATALTFSPSTNTLNLENWPTRLYGRCIIMLALSVISYTSEFRIRH
jgi:hypothetical protein